MRSWSKEGLDDLGQNVGGKLVGSRDSGKLSCVTIISDNCISRDRTRYQMRGCM